jgi:hypothetical protein
LERSCEFEGFSPGARPTVELSEGAGVIGPGVAVPAGDCLVPPPNVGPGAVGPVVGAVVGPVEGAAPVDPAEPVDPVDLPEPVEPVEPPDD